MSGCLLGMAVTYIYPGLGEVVGVGARTLWYDHLDILVLVSDCDLYLPWWGLGGGCCQDMALIIGGGNLHTPAVTYPQYFTLSTILRNILLNYTIFE